MAKLFYEAPKLTKLTEADVRNLTAAISESLEERAAFEEVRITVADIRAALEECSACCLDEPEEVEKVLAAILRRAR